MPLEKPWQDLTRETVASAPDRLGVYELGDEDGTVLEVRTGPLRDDLKTALAYSDAQSVRWTTAASREAAERIAAEHRERRS